MRFISRSGRSRIRLTGDRTQRGGELEIVAHFPDGPVRINQFEELEEEVEESQAAIA